MSASRPALARVRRVFAANSSSFLVVTLGATNVLRLASNLVLTRLLAPEAFGVIGVLSSITFILQMLTDMGYHAFVVRARDPNPHFLNVIWTVRLVRSVVLTLLMLVSAGLIATAFRKPELTTPIMATSFLFFLEGVRSLYFYTAERARRISYVTGVEFLTFALQIAITIVAALLMRSYWAIIIGMYAGAILQSVFSYTLFPGGLHRIAFDREIGADLWRFARVVIASSVITLILSQADKVFIGRTLTLEVFGLYMLAVNLTSAALQLARTYVTRILLPLFAETFRNAPDTLREVYYSSRRRMTLGLSFLIGGGIGGGDLIIRILFDDRYLEAGPFVSLLFIAPLFVLISYPADMLMVITGRIRSAVEANIVRLAWIVVAAPLGFHFYGMIGLVAAFALIEFVAVFYWWRRLGRSGYLNVKEEALPLGAAALGAAIGFGADLLAKHLIATGALPAF